ncbi:MAG: hypothetical protein R2710_07260 [Acidimicrobiales bacterium]
MVDELRAGHTTTDATADLSIDQIQITAGCNQAFCVIASALCEPGDEMIISVPTTSTTGCGSIRGRSAGVPQDGR